MYTSPTPTQYQRRQLSVINSSNVLQMPLQPYSTIQYSPVRIVHNDCLAQLFQQLVISTAAQQLNMSKLLEELKALVTKCRNLSYCGKYADSVSSYGNVIETITGHIPSITDRTLITQWNRLLDQLKSERDIASNMREVLLGNFDTNKPKQKQQLKEEGSERQLRFKQNMSNDMNEREINGNPSFKKRNVVHQDDEVYNRREKEIRDKDRAERLEADKQRELKQKEFDQREAEIWPKKKPLPKRNVSRASSNNFSNQGSVAENKSGVNKNRDYAKPWMNGVKAGGKEQNGEEKKSTYLKSVYPEGPGPDSNLIEMLQKEVVNSCPEITFDDIAELDKAKDVLEQAVLLPLLMPHLFTGIRRAWKGVLLFGPPGTGKTLLAKAIASGGKTTFFNVTASTIASKWKGDSQKLVRILFDMAKFYAPTTIFFDQIDALASKRGEREDQSSRKVKTELMARLDGVSSGDEAKSIVVIGASNCPWDIDDAIRRRLEKRIYIPLPNQLGRREMLKINLKNEKLENVDLEELVKGTDGFSGADIASFCREAAYMPMRKKLKKQGGIGKRLGNLEWMKDFQKEVSVPLTMQDFHDALKSSKPSVGKGDLARYEEWMNEFGEQA